MDKEYNSERTGSVVFKVLITGDPLENSVQGKGYNR